MSDVLRELNRIVWGLPTILLILSAGIYLTVKSGGYQLTHLPAAIKNFIKKLKPDSSRSEGVSAYEALCTALAATVGTGNIAGVAGAIALGGPGAIFWMWICALLGMIIKCAEATLAVHYRQCTGSGEVLGGPMYFIEKGLGLRWKWLAVIYAFFGVVAAFGVGNATQINAVIGGIHSACNYFGSNPGYKTDLIIAALIAGLVGIMLCGGAKRIGQLAQGIVPVASLVYIALGMGVLLVRYTEIPNALSSIFIGAFCPQAVTGGVIGSVFLVCRTGSARGVFSNEAGIGTAAIAHAAAKVNHPAQQGLMGIMEVFIDTIIICTVTALVILCSGVPIPYGQDIGGVLTTNAFSQIYGGWVSVVIAVALICFALATVLGWGLYGLRCAQYLFGERVWPLFVLLQVATVILSATLKTGTVWLLAETVNGLMAIPNLIAIILLSKDFLKLTKEYKNLI